MTSVVIDDRPNILFIFSDQQHWQALGCQDPFYQTPNLDALAAEGLLFERAFCTTPQCSPSRSSMFTGCYPTTTGVMGNIGAAGGEPLRMATVAPQLGSLGYRTAYYGKWHLGKDPEGTTGWDEELGVMGPPMHHDERTTQRALDFIGRCGASGDQDVGQPFALFLSYDDPHDIYEFDPASAEDVDGVPLPESWHRQRLDTVPAVQQAFMTQDQGTRIRGMGPQVWKAYRLFYRQKVRKYDDHVGRVLAALEAAGLRDRTIVVATSDHGDMDTHHHLIFKGPFMYEHMVRIPLIFRVPEALGGTGARQITHVTDVDVVNTDLVPTLLDFCGAGAGAAVGEGHSLYPLLTGAGVGTERPYVVSQYYSKQRWVNPIRMIRTPEYKYNVYLVHGEELYDLKNDPHECVNLAEDPGYAGVRRRLSSELDHWIETHRDPFYSLQVTDRAGTPIRAA
ncbi:MAG: sulfatase family protein [Anaerolineae bacterium]